MCVFMHGLHPLHVDHPMTVVNEDSEVSKQKNLPINKEYVVVEIDTSECQDCHRCVASLHVVLCCEWLGRSLCTLFSFVPLASVKLLFWPPSSKH